MFSLRVLVADDQAHVRNLIEARIKKCGQGAFAAITTLTDSAEEAVRIASEDPNFDLVLLDIDYRESESSLGMTGHEAATMIRLKLPRARIILVSALGGIEHQVLAHKNASVDRMLSRTDFSDETLRHLCVWACLTRLHDENRLVSDELRILTRSATMRRYLDHLDRIRPDSNVVVYGETGTGKELSARRLSANAKFASGQLSRQFAALNCGQITENLIEAKLFGYVKGAFTGADQTTLGLFDAAQDGDLFLDELQNAPIKLQHVLMRAIQEKTYTPLGTQRPKTLKVRFIAALNKNLADMKDAGTLMPDFVARLQQDYAEIPPLRERLEDLPLLLSAFLKRKGATDIKLTPEAWSFLQEIRWSENVRAVERVATALSTHAKVPLITPEMLLELPVVQGLRSDRTQSAAESVSRSVQSAPEMDRTYDEARLAFEKEYFAKLATSEDSLRQLAKRSGLSRNTLSAKLERLGLNRFHLE